MDLRCDHRLHGRVRGDTIEFVCRSKLCGKMEGVVVVHRFSLASGELVSTDKFRELPQGGTNGSPSKRTALRSA